MPLKSENIKNRDLKMKERMNYLYNLEGKRLDFIYEILQKEFFLSKVSIQRRLKNVG
jgi:hypothetical protein